MGDPSHELCSLPPTRHLTLGWRLEPLGMRPWALIVVPKVSVPTTSGWLAGVPLGKEPRVEKTACPQSRSPRRWPWEQRGPVSPARPGQVEAVRAALAQEFPEPLSHESDHTVTLRRPRPSAGLGPEAPCPRTSVSSIRVHDKVSLQGAAWLLTNSTSNTVFLFVCFLFPRFWFPEGGGEGLELFVTPLSSRRLSPGERDLLALAASLCSSAPAAPPPAASPLLPPSGLS